MKKVIIVALFFIGILLSLSLAISFKNLRGIGPVVKPPPKDITREINTTGYPLRLSRGFSISIFAKNVENPRVLSWDSGGTLLVSMPLQGKIVALPDKNGDGIADETFVVVDELNRPHGLAFHPTNKSLYIAEADHVAIYDYDKSSYKAINKRNSIELPAGGYHFTRTIGFGPDGGLYISVGSSCNACSEQDSRRAAILVVDSGLLGRAPQQRNRGMTPKVFASGLRNSVFFTWHPVTKQMWATDMGRDLIGDDLPPDEVNIVKVGAFYGWPYCYGKSVRDTTFSDPKGLNLFGFQGLTLADVCNRSEPSHIDIPAHSAPLGLAFIPSTWPSEYRDDLLVAYHGSWNRSEPTGYKVVRMKLDAQGNYQGAEEFITGWLTGDGALGRPVDLLFDTQGVLYISDDKAGVIYRVSRM